MLITSPRLVSSLLCIQKELSIHKRDIPFPPDQPSKKLKVYSSDQLNSMDKPALIQVIQKHQSVQPAPYNYPQSFPEQPYMNEEELQNLLSNTPF